MEICEDYARRLVAKEWQTILRIADALFDRSYLSYSEFFVLYEALTTPKHCASSPQSAATRLR